jgi:cytochrome d ubiquinol oxidase subunit I
MVILLGHTQAQYMVKIQPMKMAAAEALWNNEDPAAMSLFTIGDEKNRRDVFAIRVPGLLSFLAYNEFSGEVKGINDIQAEYEKSHGPGNYVPPVAISYWTFRMMAGAGFVMLGLLLFLLVNILRNRLDYSPLTLKMLIWTIGLPYLANSTGWIFTEMARQPWTVFGVMRIEDSVSTSTSAGEVMFSLIAFTLLYGALMAVTIYLLKKYATTEGLALMKGVDTTVPGEA